MNENKQNNIISTVKEGLSDYLNEKQLEFIIPYFLEYPLRLKIVHVKKSYWGLCRFPRKKEDYFLITLVRTDAQAHFFLVFLHEIAHMLAHLSYGEKISSSHGKEWGMIVRNLIVQSAKNDCFSNEVMKIIAAYLSRPSKLTNARMGEIEQKVMLLYKPDIILVGSLPSDAVFILKNGMTLRFQRKLRKYFECIEVNTGKQYRVNPDAEVENWHSPNK